MALRARARGAPGDSNEFRVGEKLKRGPPLKSTVQITMFMLCSKPHAMACNRRAEARPSMISADNGRISGGDPPDKSDDGRRGGTLVEAAAREPMVPADLIRIRGELGHPCGFHKGSD